mgnify:CR=1 FL=1
MDRLHQEPYTISTATAGGAFFAEMVAVGGRSGLPKPLLATYGQIAVNATRWLTRAIASNGTIPYIITPPTLVLLEGAWSCHVLTASTVTYDQAEHCPMRLPAWADSQAIGGRERLRSKVIAYMNVCVSFPLINSQYRGGLQTQHIS